MLILPLPKLLCIQIQPILSSRFAYVHRPEQEGELSLMDLSGNVKRNGIIQKSTQWITLGTSDLFPGMYVIKINDGSKVYYRKVLVQH